MIASRWLAFLLLPSLAVAAGTTTWEMNSYDDFIKGRFRDVALDKDGHLLLSQNLETLFSSGQPAIWSIARAPDGTLYLGTGHRGRVYRLQPDGTHSLYWQSDEPEIFALALDAHGVLFAATSPDGKIYRIENGKGMEYFNPKQKYIWSLAIGKDGALYAGTGENGKIFRITAGAGGAGAGEVWYDTGQSHVTALAIDPEGRLLAGTEPNGILYRVSAKDKAFVLYDSTLPEIRAVATAPDGMHLCRRYGRIGAKMMSTARGHQGRVRPSDRYSHVDHGYRYRLRPSRRTAAAEAKARRSRHPADADDGRLPPSLYELPGVDKSAVYRISPDLTVETLWVSKDENVYDLEPVRAGVSSPPTRKGASTGSRQTAS